MNSTNTYGIAAKRHQKTAAAAAVLLAVMMVLASVTSPVHAATKSYSSTTGGKSAILVSGKTVSYSGITVTKSGNTSSEKADFNGTNAAILAKNKATLTIKNATITTSGKHANGVFAYGKGTTVKISDSKITTKKNMSGGIMTTGGATMKATNLIIKTAGNSSAAIRSDRGGGTVTVNKGTYKTTGVGSPAIYSTAKITVSNATLSAAKSEAVVIEGGNSVTLKNCKVTGNNSKLNGQSKVKTNVMIYQSMSGDASSGSGTFTMSGGSLTSKTGCLFYVTNTTAKINLTNVDLSKPSNARLMTIAAGPWGKSGSNGGTVTLNAKKQTLKGNIYVDSKSSLKLNLKSGSTFRGRIKGSGTAKVVIEDGSKWVLTGNCSIKSLSCSKSCIDLNGYTLTVNGKKYSN